MKAYKVKKCICCGKDIIYLRGNYLFCSQECKYIYHKSEREKEIQNGINAEMDNETMFGTKRVCKLCGRTFLGFGKIAFCSHRCYEVHKSATRKNAIPEKIYKNVCISCGKVDYSNKKTDYCSESCRLKNKKSIAECESRARELGVSYGLYTGLYDTPKKCK